MKRCLGLARLLFVIAFQFETKTSLRADSSPSNPATHLSDTLGKGRTMGSKLEQVDLGTLAQAMTGRR